MVLASRLLAPRAPLNRLLTTSLRTYSTAQRTSDRVPTNDAHPPTPAQNVSESNAPLVESAVEAEEKRVMQAPNRKGVWSRSQAPREVAMSGPRFEQTVMEMQVRTHD
jgi:NADH dehydrogenase (ubiquinone) Fe-S protein 6